VVVVALDGEVDQVLGGSCGREREDEEEEENLEEGTRHSYNYHSDLPLV
jgi:hypothetical protein